MSGREADGRLDIVLLYPELLGTYGDRGNALVLAARAGARGIDARVVEVSPDDPVPATADVYCLGGGEDATQALAARLLGADDGLRRAVDAGAPVLAVCAGFQLLAREWRDREDRAVPGLGLLDVTCARLPGARAVGEVLADPVGLPGLPTLSGYENHRGDAVLAPGAAPLGRVRRGVGNGVGGTEGAVSGHVVATYLHGPVLARNPALADQLLSWAVGKLPPMPPGDTLDPLASRLRAERLAATRSR